PERAGPGDAVADAAVRGAVLGAGVEGVGATARPRPAVAADAGAADRTAHRADAVGHQPQPGGTVRGARVGAGVVAALAGAWVGREGTPRAKPKAPAVVYQLKITLKDIRPPVWRRVQVKDCTLARLHDVIQASVGWDGYHLHAFDVGGEEYGEPDPDGMLE